ncbi:hypothetical protein LAG90_02445 [Marinilongibacter aquaticus]|uniref:hypothetical protein n=1 Tax=Marinilongibacter aquaticus TaxID=2975157 RepID=UPI0021BD1D95|nr:hypothetical protein [Marinilongibacter aquaticus]UBM59515.1 hypothetical protein LAG90_02445 [Marinilongibacter aquaticus]
MSVYTPYLYYPYTTSGLDNYINNGKLIAEKYYNQANQLQKETQYTYYTPNVGNPILTGYRWFSLSSCYSPIFSVSRFERYIARSLLYEKSEITYQPDGTNPITRVTRYAYGQNHQQPIKTSLNKSNGDSLVYLTKYVKDYALNGMLSGDALYLKQLNDRNINATIENLSFLKKSGETDATMKAIAGQLMLYGIYGDVDNLKPKQLLNLETNQPIAVSKSQIISSNLAYDSHYKPRINYSHNSFGLISEQWPQKGLKNTYGYTAKGQMSQSVSAGNSSNPQTTSYQYLDFFGLNKITDPSQRDQRFYYDKLGRLSYATDPNGKVTETYDYHYDQLAAPNARSIVSSSLRAATLQATGSTGTITRTGGNTGGSLTVPTELEQNHNDTCNYNGCSSQSATVRIPDINNNWLSHTFGSSVACTEQISNAFTLRGSGAIFNLSPDTYHWAYKEMTGDFSLIVKIANIPAVDGQRSGIVIRQDFQNNSPFYTLFQDGNAHIGAIASESSPFLGYNSAALNTTWLKLVKVGNTLTGYFGQSSTNTPPTTWDNNYTGGSITYNLPLTGTYYLGLAVWGSNNTTTFNNISGI